MINVTGEFTVIKLIEEQAMSAGGIVLSEKPKGVLPKGEVISSKVAEKGDKVLLLSPGNKALIGSDEVFIVKNEFIVGVLDD
jgi:co-chaperonin GroES (HSP10)